MVSHPSWALQQWTMLGHWHLPAVASNLQGKSSAASGPQQRLPCMQLGYSAVISIHMFKSRGLANVKQQVEIR